MQQKVLVVEDEAKIRNIVKLYLEKDGFDVFEAATGTEALAVFEAIEPDLVILDLMLPELSGTEVCAYIRSRWDTPIIMLTAKTSEEERIAGLQSGADDYVTKPFSPKELVARVNAVLRRKWGKESAELASADGVVRMNRTKHETRVAEQEISLTPTEYRLLELFLSNPGVVFSRSELAERAFGWDFQGYEETIYVHIKNLRKKIEAHTTTQYIATVYGMGYKWVQ